MGREIFGTLARFPHTGKTVTSNAIWAERNPPAAARNKVVTAAAAAASCSATLFFYNATSSRKDNVFVTGSIQEPTGWLNRSSNGLKVPTFITPIVSTYKRAINSNRKFPGHLSRWKKASFTDKVDVLKCKLMGRKLSDTRKKGKKQNQ